MSDSRQGMFGLPDCSLDSMHVTPAHPAAPMEDMGTTRRPRQLSWWREDLDIEGGKGQLGGVCHGGQGSEAALLHQLLALRQELLQPRHQAWQVGGQAILHSTTACQTGPSVDDCC